MSSPTQATAPVASPTPTSPSLPTKPPPPGFKWITAKKPDGTFVTAKKRLTPAELEAQQKAEAENPTPNAAPETASATTTNGASAESTTPVAAVQYKVFTARKPDGTLVKVKRPLKPGEVASNAPAPQNPTAATPASPTTAASDPAATTKEPTPSEATAVAPEPELSASDKELLREQALANKKQRRGRFGTALLVGLLGVAGSTIPDLMDGDEIMSDSDWDFSDDDHDDDDDDDKHHDPEDGDKAGSNGSSAANTLAPVAAGVATAAVGAAATAALAPQPQQPKPANRHLNPDAPQANGDEEKKGEYKVTVKDLKDLDEKAEQEASENRLSRRWADFSFYLMASLSVILPLLFLILSIFIISMDGKSTEEHWGKMIDAIKIAITVWPIVFAAVTAQGFKTWASYKVERGVKLMELEQLVGSNSFGAVMKQPFLLRRLDLLTIGIFVIWALSPIGSQALIRSYTLKRGMAHESAAVAYVPILGDNMLLTPHARNEIKNNTILSELWQMAAVYYIGSSMTPGTKHAKGAYAQDMYNHPWPVLPYHNYQLSGYGLPLILPSPLVNPYSEEEKGKTVAAAAKAESPTEELKFSTTSSYFKLNCGEWRQEDRAALTGNGTFFTWSLSQTLGLEFIVDPNYQGDPDDKKAPMTGIKYASLLDHSVLLDRDLEAIWSEIEPKDDWKYGVIECRWEQEFYKAGIHCIADVKEGSTTFDCQMAEAEILSPEVVKPEWHTALGDFSYELLMGSTPYPIMYPATPLERWAISQRAPDGAVAQSHFLSNDPELAAYVTPESFAENFGYMFNTFIHLTHCVQCVDSSYMPMIRPDLLPPPEKDTSGGFHGWNEAIVPETIALYVQPGEIETSKPVKAQHEYTPPGLVFVIDWRWVAILLASCVVLLIIGIASIVLESFLIAPDVLGYASSLVRNSRYLHLPKTAAKPMSGPEKARTIGSVSVMIQDVKPDKAVGKIALGLHHDRAEKLKPGRLYR